MRLTTQLFDVLSDDIHSYRGSEGERWVEQARHREVHRASVQEPSNHSLCSSHSPPQPFEIS